MLSTSIQLCAVDAVLLIFLVDLDIDLVVISLHLIVILLDLVVILLDLRLGLNLPLSTLVFLPTCFRRASTHSQMFFSISPSP